MTTAVAAPSAKSESLSTRKRLLNALSYAALVFLAFFFLFPLIFLIMTTFKNNDLGISNPPTELQLMKDMNSIAAFFPNANMGLDNFRDMTGRINFWLALFNSSLIVSVIVMLGLVVNSSFAYALARMQFWGRNILITMVISLIIIPFEAIAVPLLLLVNQFGWLNSYHVQIIPFAANAFTVYLFYQFFIGLPKELEEAAFVDGASRFRIYWSIILPLSGPVFATATVLQFLAQWGNLLWPVMVVRGEQFAPLPLAMQSFFGLPPRQWGDIMAFALMTTLPTLLLFLFFQRWFIRSAVSSGVKG